MFAWLAKKLPGLKQVNYISMDNKIASNKEIVLRQWFAAKHGNKFENFQDWKLPKGIADFYRDYTRDNPNLQLSFNFVMYKLRDVEHEIRINGQFNVFADEMQTEWLDASYVAPTITEGAESKPLIQAVAAPKKVELHVARLDEMEYPTFRHFATETLFDQVASEIPDLPGFLSGSVIICCGESGVGKSTLLIDLLAKVKAADPTVEPLYISTEMTKTDLYFYMQKMKKIGSISTLLMHEYLKHGLREAIELAFMSTEYSIILLDSYQDLVEKMADILNWRAREAENFIIGLMVEAAEKLGKCIIAIQHLTKGGEYVGRTFLKHTTTAMLEIRFDKGGRRFATFSKNRRCGGMINVPLFFDLDKDGSVVFDVDYFEQMQRSKEVIAAIGNKQKQIDGSFAAIFDGMKGKGPAQQSELEDTDVTFNIVSGNEEDD